MKKISIISAAILLFLVSSFIFTACGPESEEREATMTSEQIDTAFDKIYDEKYGMSEDDMKDEIRFWNKVEMNKSKTDLQLGYDYYRIYDLGTTGKGIPMEKTYLLLPDGSDEQEILQYVTDGFEKIRKSDDEKETKSSINETFDRLVVLWLGEDGLFIPELDKSVGYSGGENIADKTSLFGLLQYVREALSDTAESKLLFKEQKSVEDYDYVFEYDVNGDGTKEKFPFYLTLQDSIFVKEATVNPSGILELIEVQERFGKVIHDKESTMHEHEE